MRVIKMEKLQEKTGQIIEFENYLVARKLKGKVLNFKEVLQKMNCSQRLFQRMAKTYGVSIIEQRNNTYITVDDLAKILRGIYRPAGRYEYIEKDDELQKILVELYEPMVNFGWLAANLPELFEISELAKKFKKKYDLPINMLTRNIVTGKGSYLIYPDGSIMMSEKMFEDAVKRIRE